ncbi:hypothetical protein FB451DRAFT_1183611 [Mycena latifolia]|nr:hypothetical protein FB451DRAFT_1183611 [Mycena latifolia]
MSTPQAIITATPAEELAALIAQVSALSKLALKMTKLCLDINDAIPSVITSQVASQVAGALAAPNRTVLWISLITAKHISSEPATATAKFIEGVAVTPNELDRAHPHGDGDYQAWYVVVAGREPGMYRSTAEADVQVLGVPGQFCQKKTSRREALDFYRTQYNDGCVVKLIEAADVAQ